MLLMTIIPLIGSGVTSLGALAIFIATLRIGRSAEPQGRLSCSPGPGLSIRTLDRAARIRLAGR